MVISILMDKVEKLKFEFHHKFSQNIKINIHYRVLGLWLELDSGVGPTCSVKKFWVQKTKYQNDFNSKKIGSQKNFGPKNSCQKMFWVKNIFWSNKIWVQKYWVRKNFGSRNFSTWKFCVQKFSNLACLTWPISTWFDLS